MPKEKIIKRVNELIIEFLEEEEEIPVYENTISQKFYLGNLDFNLPSLHFILKNVLEGIEFKQYMIKYFEKDE